MKNIKPILVQVRYNGGAYCAKTGIGKQADCASSTMAAWVAAKRAAAKWFGVAEDKVKVEAHDGANPDSAPLFHAELKAEGNR